LFYGGFTKAIRFKHGIPETDDVIITQPRKNVNSKFVISSLFFCAYLPKSTLHPLNNKDGSAFHLP